jgi:hypothetical protein
MAKLWVTHVDEKLAEALRRIVNLEQQVANQAIATQKVTCGNSRGPLKTYEIKAQAAAATQATEHLYAPLREETPSMRGDVAAIVAMKAFIERFLAYDDLGQVVNACVRDDAREALGRARAES